MSIEKVSPPQTVPGKHHRLSEKDLANLASIVKSGEWASDGIPTKKKGAAYQRAQSAVKALGKRYQLRAIKTSVCPVDDNDPDAGFIWSIGPRPEGETPRKPRETTIERLEIPPRAPAVPAHLAFDLDEFDEDDSDD